MALSLLQSWEPLVDHLIHDNQSEVADALLGFFSDPLDAAHLPIDSLFDPPLDSLYDGKNASPLPSLVVDHPCFSAPSTLSLPPDLHAPSDVAFDLRNCPKRPRSCGDLYCPPPDPMLEANSCNVAMPCYQLPEHFSSVAPPPPAVGLPACNGERKVGGGGGCLSAQSVAARARRKRISEKTQELGRLIPGGNKMNTAEMFQAAYKYVKFLQAQIRLLGLMGSIKGWNMPQQVEQKLQALLASAIVQEKLSGEGRCVVPMEAVVAMSKDRDIQSNPLISRDLDRFVGGSSRNSTN